MTNSQQLAQKIQDHLKSGGAVRFCTYARCTILSAKHASLIFGSIKEQPMNGVYMQRGKSNDFWLEQYIAFSK